jgi:glyoxylase I family protein
MPEPLAISAVNHLAVVTNRLEESRKFYRDVLGFREIWRPNFTFPGAWLFNYGLTIHILGKEQESRAAGRTPAIQTRDPHLALHANDLAAVERLLEEHGIPFRRNMQADTGVRQLFFQDPDGYHIEVGTYPPLRMK